MGGFGSETLQIQKVPEPASTRWWLNQSRVFWHYDDLVPAPREQQERRAGGEGGGVEGQRPLRSLVIRWSASGPGRYERRYQGLLQ